MTDGSDKPKFGWKPLAIAFALGVVTVIVAVFITR